MRIHDAAVLSRPPLLPAPTPPATPRSVLCRDTTRPSLEAVEDFDQSHSDTDVARANRLLQSPYDEGVGVVPPVSLPDVAINVPAKAVDGDHHLCCCTADTQPPTCRSAACNPFSSTAGYPSPSFGLPMVFRSVTPADSPLAASVSTTGASSSGRASPEDHSNLLEPEDKSTEAAERRAHALFTLSQPPPAVLRTSAVRDGRRVVHGGFVTAASIAPVASSSAVSADHGQWGQDTPSTAEAHVRGEFRRDQAPDEDELTATRLYQVLLEGAESSAKELEPLEQEGVAYLSGPDHVGRRAIVLVGCRIHDRCSSATSRKLLLLYLVRLVKAACSTETPRSEFTVVLLATGMATDGAGSTFNWLRDVLTSLPLALTRRLAALYLVHPALRTRLAFALLGIMLWGRLTFIDRLEQLRQAFPPGALLLPQFVMQHEFIASLKRSGGKARTPSPSTAALDGAGGSRSL